MYIYIYREREIFLDNNICISIYIYIYREREREKERRCNSGDPGRHSGKDEGGHRKGGDRNRLLLSLRVTVCSAFEGDVSGFEGNFENPESYLSTLMAGTPAYTLRGTRGGGHGDHNEPGQIAES